MEVLSLILKLT